MKQLLVQYAHYNFWANQRITDVILNLPDDMVHKDIPSSFPSIFKTLIHIMEVEEVWWQRMKLFENPVQPGQPYEGNLVELTTALVNSSRRWKEWVDVATEAALSHEFIYKNSKKDQFKQPVHEVLMHLFNHQSYHRGQLVTMMRMAGITAIPSTDLISFLRKK